MGTHWPSQGSGERDVGLYQHGGSGDERTDGCPLEAEPARLTDECGWIERERGESRVTPWFLH